MIKIEERNNIFYLYSKLWANLEKSSKLRISYLFILMILVSCIEIVSIGSAIPFLSVLTNANINDSRFINIIPIDIINTQGRDDLIILFSSIFGFLALLAGISRLYLIWCLNHVAFLIGKFIGCKIYENTLIQDYQYHLNINSSKVINALSNQTNLIVYNIVLPLLTLISSIIMMLIIIIGLYYIDPIVAISSITGFGFLYLIVIKFSKKISIESSRTIAINSTQLVKIIQESLGGIRDIILNNTQDFYFRLYKKIDGPLRLAQSTNSFISNFPRYAVEGISMAMIAFFAFILTKNSVGISAAIPILGAFAFAAQRLMPIMQQGYSSYAQIRGEQYTFADAIELLDVNIPRVHLNPNVSNKFTIKNYLELRDISFSYAGTGNKLFNGINLFIPKGERLGIIGETGSGKSTLLDIVMGLLKPDSGGLYLDGVRINHSNYPNWRANISHVPQYIFLADSSIKENIALGVAVDDIDMNLLVSVCQQARIHEFILSLPDKYDSFVGERGVRLSGGQKQRIGIARALYKKPSLIIFDEATSALDMSTESEVMDSIYSLNSDLTVFIVTHRLDTLKKCDVIYSLKNKKIIKI